MTETVISKVCWYVTYHVSLNVGVTLKTMSITKDSCTKFGERDFYFTASCMEQSTV